MNENKQNDESWYIKIQNRDHDLKIYHFKMFLDVHMKFIRNDLSNDKNVANGFLIFTLP